jgi:hypothetical protein
LIRFVACLCLAAAALPCRANTHRFSSDITVIVDFKGSHSSGVTQAMEREASAIMKDAGVNLAWHSPAGAATGTYGDLVVVTFKGSCEADSEKWVDAEPGSYARTWIADGEVQPFGEVDCQRVVRSVRNSLESADIATARLLAGRALGRVLAHELVHMITRSEAHGRSGVGRASLSGRELVQGSLRLEPTDVLRVHEALWRRQPQTD